MTKLLRKYSTFELVLCAFLAALGIASKPFIMPLVYCISTPLLIPSGAIAGGFYMLWLVLGGKIVNKPLSATLIGLIQALMVMLTGTVGSHGILDVIIYTLPGLAIDIVLYLLHKEVGISMVIACGVANVTGLCLTNAFFYRMPAIPLATALTIGFLSGCFGGGIASQIYVKLKKSTILLNL